MLKHHSKSMIFLIATCLLTAVLAPAVAWAYKVEKICESLPATSKEPAQKKCKVVRVTEGSSGKSDGKGDGKADPKKDAKAGGH
jgi:hypothetical protein